MEITIEALVVQIQAGDRDAFSQIYSSFINRIYKYIFYRIYAKEIAEDLTSQTFLKAVEKIHSYKSNKGSFAAWLYRIARNLVIDYLRSNRIKDDIFTLTHLSQEDDVEKTVLQKESLEQLQNFMDGLEINQREIILLRVWDGLSYKEISQVMGKSEKNCKMIFSRALAKLRSDFSTAAVLVLFFLFK